jgi:hypothetical protein
VANPDFTRDQLQAVLEQPEQLNKMLYETVMRGSRGLEYVVQDLLDKRKEMERLALRVRENLTLLQEIDILLQAQGEALETIEQNL